VSVILVLIAFSVTLAAGFLIAFFWSVRSGQYDDTYGASVRILFDDEAPVEEHSKTPEPFSTQQDQSPNQ
jgi:cbb3-type cytochrome oxidase maturation protein